MTDAALARWLGVSKSQFTRVKAGQRSFSKAQAMLLDMWLVGDVPERHHPNAATRQVVHDILDSAEGAKP
jgi:hypothetical protein